MRENDHYGGCHFNGGRKDMSEVLMESLMEGE